MSYSVGILGCGVMGQSFLSAVQKHRVLGTAEDKAKLPTKFYTTNHSESSIDNLKKVLEENVKKISEESLDNYGFDDHECYTGKDNLTLIEKSDVILISIKPYQMEQVLTQVKESGLELKNKVFISLVAGWTTASMREILGDDEMIITRLMTNTPAKFGEGAVVVSHTGKEEYLQKWKANMNFMIEQLGVMCELPESKMDAATALVGSGPAFVLNFLEAMVDAGIKMGIPYKESYILALKTVEGTAKMGQLTNYTHPSVLKHQVCTPGGTTIAGLVEMDNRGVKSGVINGITEAARVASELGKKK